MNNPVIKGFFADPDIACFDGKYYIYPTSDGNDTYFKAFSSCDLKDWKDEGIILDFADVPWTENRRAWAPAIGSKNGKYYFYYSGNCNIGVAVCDTPVGKFKDTGKPLIAQKQYIGTAIDPDVFVDDDGNAYLYWGNGSMLAAQLSQDMISLAGEPVNLTPPHFNEGSCVFKRNGIYYFTWCYNDCRSPEYQVRYGKSDSPLKMPEGDTVILSRHNAQSSKIKGTAHHSVLNVPGTDDWYICYHRFEINKYGDFEGDYVSIDDGVLGQEGYREICIDKLEFDEQGNIIPVKATL